MNGSEALIKKLKENGTDVIFGYPGEVLLPVYDSIYDSDIKHILVRHEQAAVHAADGYARASGKTGVCIASSGYGTTNIITGIATAQVDSSPVLALTGQVETDSFQEINTMKITETITKKNFQPKNSSELPRIIDDAFRIASSRRQGAVVVDLPKNILVQEVTEECMNAKVAKQGNKIYTKENLSQIKKVIQTIKNSKKPIILAGGGVISADASNQLLEFATETKIPVTTTLMGKGSIPEDHELSLGLLGMHGLESTNYAVAGCDCLIAIGCRFSNHTTGNVSEFAKNATKIQIDIDSAEIGKNVDIDIPIIGNANIILEKLIEEINTVNHNKWIKDTIQKRQNKPKSSFGWGSVKPLDCIKEIMDAVTSKTIVTTDVGQNQIWMANYFKTKNARTFISNGGLGTIGFGLPAAIGAQIAKPDENVLVVCGDGGFQRSFQELATIKEYDLPMVICIFNNGVLGLLYQYQMSCYNNRISQTTLIPTPNYVKLAESYGICGVEVEKTGELVETIQNAFKERETTIIDINIDPQEFVPYWELDKKETLIVGKKGLYKEPMKIETKNRKNNKQKIDRKNRSYNKK